MKYDVFLFDVVKVKYPGIEADSQKAAISKTLLQHYPNDIHDKNRPQHGIEYVEYADELECALVNESGDEEFEHACWYDKCELALL